MAGRLPKFAMRVCRTHGETEFVLEGRGYYRCKKCRQQRVIDWRRRAKRRLIAEAGGACQICGYDRYSGALHFHHIDPATKAFGISKKGFIVSIEKMRAEAAKCALLCSNCHAEVEGGIATLPTPVRGSSIGRAAPC
jgi:5-methylcytosine-specific restriction endonuclease McrA